MEQKKIIAVANPSLIPGGLETVRKAVAEYLQPEEYTLIERHVPAPYWFTPRADMAVHRAASSLAAQALESETGARPHVSMAFLHGKQEWRSGMHHLYACALYQGGSSGRGSTTNAPRVSTDTEALRILVDLLKYPLQKKH